MSSTAGSDYTQPGVSTVTFDPDQMSASHSVPIVDDSNIEDTETFTATLSTTESGVTIGDDTATVTILDDDSELFNIMASVTSLPSDSPSLSLSLTLSLSLYICICILHCTVHIVMPYVLLILHVLSCSPTMCSIQLVFAACKEEY